MPDKSSAPESQGLPWHRTTLWWPFECVPVRLEIVHPRKLTALEWVLLRVVDGFREEPPTLAEMVEELGIAEKEFMEDTLKTVVRLRALQPRGEGESWDDLSDLAFTDSGYQLFKKGQIEGEPAFHGTKLYFDALTDEESPEPVGMREETEAPFPPGELPQPREGVGLDRARGIVARFHGELVKANGEVRDIQPQPENPSRVVWAPREIELRLTETGEVVPKAPLSPKAMQILQSDDQLNRGILPPAPHTGDWNTANLTVSRSEFDYDGWRNIVSTTLPTDRVRAEVLRIVGGARQELLLHAGWYEDPDVERQIEQLALKGVRVLLLGTERNEVFAFDDTSSLGFIAGLASNHPLPVAVLADGGSGILVDGVTLRYGQGHALIELAGMLNPEHVQAVHGQMLKAAGAALDELDPTTGGFEPLLETSTSLEEDIDNVMSDSELQLGIVRLALSGAPSHRAWCAGRICQIASGPERVTALERLWTLTTPLVSEATATTVANPAPTAWHSLIERFDFAYHGIAEAKLLCRIAPAGTVAGELGRLLEQHPMPNLLDTLEAACEFLQEFRKAVDARWGLGIFANTSEFRDYCLRVLDSKHQGILSGEEIVSAARRILAEKDLTDWANGRLQALGTPGTVPEFTEWMNTANSLGDISGSQVRGLAKQFMRQLASDFPNDWDSLVEVGAELLNSASLLACMVPDKPTLEQVEMALMLVKETNLTIETATKRTLIDNALPDLTETNSAKTADEIVQVLLLLGKSEIAFIEVGREWAQRTASARCANAALSEFPSRISELRFFKPLLQDVTALASEPVRRFQGPLRKARDNAEPVWEQLRVAWTGLGLPEDKLVEVLGKTAQSQQAGPKSAKSKKRRKRK